MIHGYLVWKSASAEFNTPSSRSVKPFQTVIFTGLRDWAPVAAEPVVLDPPLLPPPQAASASVPSRMRVKALRLTGTSPERDPRITSR